MRLTRKRKTGCLNEVTEDMGHEQTTDFSGVLLKQDQRNGAIV